MKQITAFLLLVASLSAPLAAQDRRDFWFLNNTGRQIKNVYIARHNTEDSWGSDVLGSDLLPFGGGTKIVFTGSRTTCMYDFKLVFADGSSQQYVQGRDLCSSVAVTFNQDTNGSLN